MIHQASFLNIFGAAHDCPTLLQLESDQLTMRRGRGTDVDTVQEVKELLDTIFTMPSLPTLDPLRAVLEMLCGCAARCVLALFADTRGGLASVSEVAPPRFKRRRRLEIGNDETVFTELANDAVERNEGVDSSERLTSSGSSSSSSPLSLSSPSSSSLSSPSSSSLSSPPSSLSPSSLSPPSFSSSPSSSLAGSSAYALQAEYTSKHS